MTVRGNLLPAAILAFLAIAALVFSTGWWMPFAQHYVHGVDVSRHQGAIDWRTLTTTDVRFAYIKASEGADYRDDRFVSNWRDAGAAGIKRGAYHYFTLCRPGPAQAANFIVAAPERGELPPAVDIEQNSPCRQGPQIEDVAAELTAYLNVLEQHYGARPLIYTTREFHDKHLADALAGETFWLRNLFAQPDFRRDAWVIWQYNHDGRRSGVSGPVDLNYFRGDETAFAKFLEMTSAP